MVIINKLKVKLVKYVQCLFGINIRKNNCMDLYAVCKKQHKMLDCCCMLNKLNYH